MLKDYYYSFFWLSQNAEVLMIWYGRYDGGMVVLVWYGTIPYHTILVIFTLGAFWFQAII